MEKLILTLGFIFISLCAVGQVQSDSIIDTRLIRYINLQTFPDIDTNKNKRTHSEIVKLLLQYSESCYKDSIAFNGWNDAWVLQSTDSLYLVSKLSNFSKWDTAYIKYNGYSKFQLFINKTIYRHREPTFKGFLEWLEKQ